MITISYDNIDDSFYQLIEVYIVGKLIIYLRSILTYAKVEVKFLEV